MDIVRHETWHSQRTLPPTPNVTRKILHHVQSRAPPRLLRAVVCRIADRRSGYEPATPVLDRRKVIIPQL